jgi:REP element-mobilizing transposase RayT
MIRRGRPCAGPQYHQEKEDNVMNIFGPNRKKCIRLPELDYTAPGAYYLTMCVQDRLWMFGNVINETMCLSSVGEMIQKAWLDLPNHDPHVSLDEFMVMPNHLHGIVVLTECQADIPLRAGTRPAPTGCAMSLIDVARRFKSSTTVQYIRGVKRYHWPPFHKRLWQRGYFDHIVRNNADLNRVREYIRNNPMNWETDPENQKSFRS